jgi:chromosome partitioning protein
MASQTKTTIIALANQKGGCGKTTSSVSIASGLARRGRSVCLVDTDPQCNASDTFGLDRDGLENEGKLSLADCFLAKAPARDVRLNFDERFDGRLSLVLGHRALGAVPHQLEAELRASTVRDDHSELDGDDFKNEHRRRLKNSLASLRGHFDFVIVDTPPELGFLMTSALIASDYFIIPVFPSGYDLKGLERLLQNVAKVQKHYNPHLALLGVVLGNFDARAKLDSDVRAMLITKFGEGTMFHTVINRGVRHREATVYGRTIFEHAEGESAAEQFLALSDEILVRVDTAAGEPSTPVLAEAANA